MVAHRLLTDEERDHDLLQRWLGLEHVSLEKPLSAVVGPFKGSLYVVGGAGSTEFGGDDQFHDQSGRWLSHELQQIGWPCMSQCEITISNQTSAGHDGR